MDNAVTVILKRAVEMDQKEQYTGALALYQEGLGILVDYIKETKDPTKKKHLQSRAVQYMERAEKIKNLINERKASGKYREQTKIEEGSSGHGYASVFGRFLDASVNKIYIEEPYVRAFHQCQNFVRFCELAVQKCHALSKISLVTTRDPEDHASQASRFVELSRSLQKRSIRLEVSYSDTLHDRKIELSNGWVIKIGRGLDYFKPPEGKFVLGALDLELRPCLETVVDIFHQSHVLDNT